jgi:hypothetical protein
MYDTRAEALACPRGMVTLAQDQKSGLVFNRTFNSTLMVYDVQYQNEQAVSGAFREHLDDIAGVIKSRFRDMSLLEVGCGKGHFLARLREAGFAAQGIDPTYEGDDPTILKEYFTASTGIRADGLVLRHVLEHVEDPYTFLRNLKDANGGAGKIYIEVPALEWILANRAWFDIFYEHVNYFRREDFLQLFGHVEVADYVFGGQYLSVVADLSSLREPRISPEGEVRLPPDFNDTLTRHADRIRERGPRRSLVWGGASKGVIFTLLVQRAGAEVGTIVDINPAKQGKFLPAVGLPVSPPAAVLGTLEADTDIYVMNSNYLDEIRQATQSRFNYFTVDHDSV